MTDVSKVRAAAVRNIWLMAFACGVPTAAWAVQAPVPVPPTHERQCVATGDVPAGGARRVTIKWSRPFPANDYTVIGSVADATEGDRSIELNHVVVPYAAGEATAVVVNPDAGAAHAGILCLDASRE